MIISAFFLLFIKINDINRVDGIDEGGEDVFQIRLKELRESRGLSQADLAQAIHTKQSTVAMWENGTNRPRNATLEKLANFFGVSTDYLLGRSDLKKRTPREKGVQIPVLGYVQAGIPVEAIEDIIDYEEIPESMARRGEFFALQIRGDSMEPKFSEGDVVIVRKQPDVNSGDIAVVLVNGDDATIKKIKKRPEGVMLIPSNPNYEPMFYSNQEIEELPVVVLGKVVELRAKF